MLHLHKYNIHGSNLSVLCGPRQSNRSCRYDVKIVMSMASTSSSLTFGIDGGGLKRMAVTMVWPGCGGCQLLM